MDRADLPLRTGALAWRAGALLVVTVLVTLGTARGVDDHWPFAPMSQFAFGVDLDADIRATYVEALTTEGTVVRVPLSPTGVGIGRAEVEGQLPSIVARPAKLQAIAVAQRRLHPDRPQYVRLWLRERVSDLVDGRVVSETDRTLAEWEVTP